MEKSETREQTIKKIESTLPDLSYAELRMVAGFINGIKKVK